MRAASVAQVCVDSLEHPELSVEDQKHLERVLRVRVGERVILTNGRGGWCTSAWTSAATVDQDGPVHVEPATNTLVTIGFSLLKGDKSEWVVQKLTELGVDRIVPLQADRSIVKWDGVKAAKNLERFRRVAHEAAMQSRRVWIPEVTEVSAVSDALASGAAIAAPGGLAPSLQQPFVVVGPEGGWSAQELAMTAPCVDLGPTILRAETASIATATLLCALRNAPVPPGA